MGLNQFSHGNVVIILLCMPFVIILFFVLLLRSLRQYGSLRPSVESQIFGTSHLSRFRYDKKDHQLGSTGEDQLKPEDPPPFVKFKFQTSRAPSPSQPLVGPSIDDGSQFGSRQDDHGECTLGRADLLV